MTKLIVVISLTLTCLYAASVSAVYSPTSDRLLNCGGRATTSDDYHRFFSPDASFLATTGGASSSHRAVILQSPDDNSTSSSISSLYRTARVFTRPTRYSFSVSPTSYYLVRFHFYPFQIGSLDLHEAEFHVVVNEFVLLRGFRVTRFDNFPVIKEFIIPTSSSEQLQITILPTDKSNFGFVNAIEVVSAPSDLIADVAYHYSNRSDVVTGLLRNGFETVHRVNVGGFKITPFNDSLSRTWVTDDDESYYRSKSHDSETSEKVYFGGRIRYRNGGASRAVGPDNMYNSARIVKTTTNLTWTFEVEKGYSHLVRLHFCDIASVAGGMLYLNIYINDKLSYEDLDLSDATNWLLSSPYYADFVVDGSSNDELVLTIGPSKMSYSGGVQAILNGAEVWKMNNSMRSFDGEVCEVSLWRSWRRERAGVFVPIMAVIVLLLVGSLAMQRRRRMTRDGVPAAVEWTRLPVDVSETEMKSGKMLTSVVKV